MLRRIIIRGLVLSLVALVGCAGGRKFLGGVRAYDVHQIRIDKSEVYQSRIDSLKKKNALVVEEATSALSRNTHPEGIVVQQAENLLEGNLAQRVASLVTAKFVSNVEVGGDASLRNQIVDYEHSLVNIIAASPGTYMRPVVTYWTKAGNATAIGFMDFEVDEYVASVKKQVVDLLNQDKYKALRERTQEEVDDLYEELRERLPTQ